MKEYMKKIPTYLVVLVSKVLEEAEELTPKDEAKNNNPINKFYQVATYCKINYHEKYAEIEGLYRVKVNSC
jgi:hypothetical protein